VPNVRSLRALRRGTVARSRLAGVSAALSAGADVASLAVGSAFVRTATEPSGTTISNRAWTIVEGPMGKGTTIGTSAALNWVLGDSTNAATTTDIRQPIIMEMAFEMTQTAENSRLDWYGLQTDANGNHAPYRYCEDILDGRGYTAGLVGFCSGSGDMLDLVQNYYLPLRPTSNPLQPYLSGLQTTTSIGTSVDAPNGGVASTAAAQNLGPNFIAAWDSTALNDPLFRQAQRQYRYDHYWSDALTQALADGVGPLGMCIYYDVLVNHGPGTDSESFGGIISYVRTNFAASRPSTGSSPNEANWLTQVVNRRNTILVGWGDDQATDGRVFFHRALITANKLTLQAPVNWSCYGDPYTWSSRPTVPNDARLGTYQLRYTATGAGSDDVFVTVT
jgi:chitosanase